MAEALIYDYREGELEPADRGLCDFAADLTLAPSSVALEDTLKLKHLGFTEAQITVATQVIGYFNYINRVAEGLGVNPEEWMQPSKEIWMKKKAVWRH